MQYKAGPDPVLELQLEARPEPVLDVGAELALAHGPGLERRPELPLQLGSEPDLGPSLLNYRQKI